MDAATQVRLGPKVEAALAAAGIVVESPIRQRGSLVGWEPVEGIRILGVLAQRGWRISEVKAEEPRPRLELLRDTPGFVEPGDDGHDVEC